MTHSLTTAEADALVAADETYIMRPWTHPKGEPVIVARAKDCVVTDVHGKDYLDLTAGYFVNNAGHCHPRIVEAATQQLTQVLQVSGKHGTIPAIRLAERLVNLLPKSINQAFFSTGGSEANEFALKIARQAAGRTDVAYLENAYHGLTLGSLEVTASEKYRESAGKPIGGHSYTIPNASCYRCKYNPNPDGATPERARADGTTAQACAVQCLDGVAAQFAARPAAAVLAEPIQSVGGLAPPRAWWERLDQLRRDAGMLLIVDEVQTGLGRTGKMFGLEHYGLEPEIVSGGKGLSGGVGSLAMTCAGTGVIAKFFGGTTPTSGGNAVSAAAGLALIETLLDEHLIENAAAMGRHFTAAAWALGDPWIGDVRFTGLLGGIELVSDRATKAVLGKAAMSAIKDALHDDGMLITVSGTHGNVLRLQPPLTITAAQIDTFLAALARVLRTVRG